MSEFRGETVTFASNGGHGEGYLSIAEGGSGPAGVVIQEGWGIGDHIKEVCDRFAAAGFTALAPDLYHGATTREPDEAGKLMMALNISHAGKDMSGAVDFLLAHPAVRGSHVGVIGFCMGGGLALVLSSRRPDAVAAVAPYYGLIPWPDAHPDWSAIAAKVRGHYAANDSFFNPAAVCKKHALIPVALEPLVHRGMRGILGSIQHLRADGLHLFGRECVFPIRQIDRHPGLFQIACADGLGAVSRHDVRTVRHNGRYVVRCAGAFAAHHAATGEIFGGESACLSSHAGLHQ